MAGAPSGDQRATASSSGSSGGIVDVRTARANASVHPTMTNTIAAGAVLTATDIVVTTDNAARVGATTSSGGGGVVTIGDADADPTPAPRRR